MQILIDQATNQSPGKTKITRSRGTISRFGLQNSRREKPIPNIRLQLTALLIGFWSAHRSFVFWAYRIVRG